MLARYENPFPSCSIQENLDIIKFFTQNLMERYKLNFQNEVLKGVHLEIEKKMTWISYELTEIGTIKL